MRSDMNIFSIDDKIEEHKTKQKYRIVAIGEGDLDRPRMR